MIRSLSIAKLVSIAMKCQAVARRRRVASVGYKWILHVDASFFHPILFNCIITLN